MGRVSSAVAMVAGCQSKLEGKCIVNKNGNEGRRDNRSEKTSGRRCPQQFETEPLESRPGTT